MKTSHINTIDPIAWSDGVGNSTINALNQEDSGRLSKIVFFAFVLAHIAARLCRLVYQEMCAQCH